VTEWAVRAVAAGAAVLAVAAMSAAPATGTSAVTVRATIDGHAASDSSERHPIRLEPAKPANLDLEVDNDSDHPLVVRTVRLSGRVLGLTFYAYDTSVLIEVGPHRSERRSFALDLSGLGGQATGLIPSTVELLDGSRHVVATQGVVVDVRGRLRSVYGLFGMAVAVLTVVWFAAALVALARGRLASNRWRRGLRFLTPGVGLGLTLVFSLSAFRVLAPLPRRWVPTMAISAAALFIAGYLTPTPPSAVDDEIADDADSDDGLGQRDESVAP